jgi:hypothetical protein
MFIAQKVYLSLSLSLSLSLFPPPRLLIPVSAFVRGINFQSVWNLLVFQVFKWLDKIYEKYLKRSSSVKTKPSSSGLKAPFIKLESVSR